MRVRSAVDIDRDVETVFTFVSDLRNDPRWRPEVVEVRAEATAGPLPTAWILRVRPILGATEQRLALARMEPQRAVELEGSLGRVPCRIGYAFTPLHAGTRVTRTVELQVRGLRRVLSPLVARRLRRDQRVFLANLKRELEHAPPRHVALGLSGSPRGSSSRARPRPPP